MGMMGCRGGPRDSVFWEERWEILGLTEHGNIVDARLIVTNRELLRGQGRVHLNYWSPSFMPVIHTREVDPREVIMDPQEDGLQKIHEGSRQYRHFQARSANFQGHRCQQGVYQRLSS